MKRLLFFFLFLLSMLSCRQSSFHGTLSSIDSVLSKHPDDVKELDELASYYQQTDHKDLLPRVYYLLGRCLHDKDSIPQAIIYYHKALECLDETQSDNVKLRDAVNAQVDSCFQELLDCADSLNQESEMVKEVKGLALHDYMYQKKRCNQLEIDNKNDLLLMSVFAIALMLLLALSAIYWQMGIIKKIKLQNKLKDLRIHSILSSMDSAHLNEHILIQVAIPDCLSQGKHLSDAQWQKLEEVFQKRYPHFKDNLYSCCKISEQEYHVCMLVKLGLGSSKISILTSKAMSTISTTKQRLFKKITRENGSAEQFVDLLSTI